MSLCIMEICAYGNDNMCEIVGIGSVQIKTHDDIIRILKNVIHTRDEKKSNLVEHT